MPCAACRQYRVNVGHNIDRVDPLTSVPLAAQICYNTAGIEFAWQVDKIQDILKYTAGNVGPLLSALCGFMWFVNVRPAAFPPARLGTINGTGLICARLSSGCQCL